MARHRRIAIIVAAALSGLVFAAFAPAAGDQRVSGAASYQKITYNEDGVPTVHSGPECRAGHGGARDHRNSADPAEF
jgi:hypothetical protein